MKRTLTILAGLLLAASAQAANFQAVAGGDLNDTNTWGVTSVPGASDNVDLNGKAITLTNSLTLASLVDEASGGSLDLGANVTFTCRAVTNAALSTSAAGVVVDCDVVNTTVGNGLTINVGGEVTIQGAWETSGGYAVHNTGGTVTDFSGTINNTGWGVAAYNDIGGTWTDFSGSIVSSGFGDSVNNRGTWTDFSGGIVNSGSGSGAYNNSGTWTDFSGGIVNSGSGSGAYNYGGTWTDFSGNLILSSANVSAIDGNAIPFSGSIKIAAQPDLSAANVKAGKVILGVTGTLATGGGSGYGINGTGLLGASW